MKKFNLKNVRKSSDSQSVSIQTGNQSLTSKLEFFPPTNPGTERVGGKGVGTQRETVRESKQENLKKTKREGEDNMVITKHTDEEVREAMRKEKETAVSYTTASW